MISTTADMVIIGSGFSGLIAAQEARRRGIDVLIVDKGFYPGGRLATKDLGNLRFNYGAPYFPAVKSNSFRAFVENMKNENRPLPFCIKRGKGISSQINVMRDICSYLAEGTNVMQQVHVTEVLRQDHQILIKSGSKKIASAKQLVISTPAPQAVCLLSNLETEMINEIENVEFSQCWTIFLGFPGVLDIPNSCHFRDNNGGLSSVVHEIRNSATGYLYCLTLRMSHEWSSLRTDWSKEQILKFILSDTLRSFLPKTDELPEIMFCHRWKYSQVIKSLSKQCPIISRDQTVGVAGDWTLGHSLEDAFMSGKKIIQELIRY